jgi:hypothetical protein
MDTFLITFKAESIQVANSKEEARRKAAVLLKNQSVEEIMRHMEVE